MVKSLNKEQQAEMRQKVHALDIFKGKKPWDCARRHEADYLEMDSNPLKEKYLVGVQNLFQTYGETHIIFSDYGKSRILSFFLIFDSYQSEQKRKIAKESFGRNRQEHL